MPTRDFGRIAVLSVLRSRPTASAPAHEATREPLRQSLVERQVAGVCGSIAHYLGTDPVLVRLAWIILTIVPGSIFLGVLAYIVAWLIVPEADPGAEQDVTARGRPRLGWSATDAKVAGVCGGLAAYFGVDAMAVRLLWVILSIFPGVIICGVFASLVAWFIMPAAPMPIVPSPPAPAAATPA